MHVVLDVNILGKGYVAEANRTGIFRATEMLVRALLRRDDLTFSVAAEHSWVNELQLILYDRDRGNHLGSRLHRAWRHPECDDEEGLAMIARILADEQVRTDSSRDRTMLTLMNATARRVSLPGPFQVVHSLRTPLPPPSRIPATARVLTVHDLIPLLHPEWMYQDAEREIRAIMASVDPHRDFVIANSEATAADVAALLPMSRERIFVTPFAADAGVFHRETSSERIEQARRRYGILPGPYLLSLGTVEPRKNLPRLLRCFFRLAEADAFSDLQLLLVGPTGWKTEEIFSTIESRPELRSRVRLAGYVPDADLAALYSGARAFVYPSLYEGFGLPVLEAMQCGAPVVTSNTSSMPEVAGDAAVCVPPADGDALYDALRRLLSDDAWAAELGRRGLERSRRYSWDLTAEATIQAYRCMLKELS
jgi:glycosyltransferase involved in cell wall biosynthesis